jgi:NifU homolog involved in Fe-S cluster formation
MRKKIIDKKILNLAFDTTNFGLKNKTKFYASHKNKKCGDKIKIELEIKNKKVKKMYYETDGCIFCQASASLLSTNIKNTLVKDLNDLVFSHKFKFLLSKKYISRRDCIMLPYQALKKII